MMWRSWENSHCQREWKLLQLLWKTIWQFFKKFNTELPRHPANRTPRYVLRRNKNIYPHKNLYTDVPGAIINNSDKVETTQKSIC